MGPNGGVRLGRVVPGTLPALLGLKSGDEIVTLNGFRIADPQQALLAYARLRDVDEWVAAVQRDGARTEIRYALR
jgi:general secretion pathway protein C